MSESTHAYQQPFSAAIKQLESDPIQGLSSAEVKKRLEEYGPNVLPDEKERWVIPKLIWHQLNSLLVLVLVIAALITYVLEHPIDTYVIVAVLIINTLIGFIQEYKASKAIEALKDIVVAVSKVYRNGEMIEIPSSQLVPGDIVYLEEGDRVPADGRLIEANNLKTIESSLTGEAFPIGKTTDPIKEQSAIGDRKNFVWMSTFVATGIGKFIVTQTGADTAIGEIATSLTEIKKEQSHFAQKTDKLAKLMSIIALIGASLVFGIGYFIRDMQFGEIFTFSVASLVSGIPEGLPAILAIVLAAGAHRMARRNAIIRSLPATETLSVVDAIGTDKTGTLTQNTMTVEHIELGSQTFEVEGDGWLPEGRILQDGKEVNLNENETLHQLLLAAGFCSRTARLINEGTDQNPSYRAGGDPTDGGLKVLAIKAGLQETIEAADIIDELPFNSEGMFKAAMAQTHQETLIYVSGAPESVINRSTKQLKNGKAVEFNKNDKEAVLKGVESASAQAMRTIGLAYRPANESETELTYDSINDLIFLGFVGMIDPPRKGAGEAVLKARAAGIRVIMMTGDHKQTALAMARQVNILDEDSSPGKFSLSMTESELQQLSDEEFDQAVEEINVFSRLTPDMKLKILGKLQEMGHTVAMTGDGVNDVLALKKADIGIAMGKIGTDVAREAADIVLADDNFASLIDAIEEGRVVFMNTRNASAFLVHTNLDEDLEILFCIVVGLPLPLLAIQVLYMNLVTDGVVDIALAAEPSHGDVLKQPPRQAGENILTKEVFRMMLPTILVMAANSLTLFILYLPQGIDKARTIAFLTMVWDQLFNIFNWRSMHLSIFEIGAASNKFVIGSLVASIALQFILLTNPFMMNIFSIVPLKIWEVALVVGASSLVLVTGELHKYRLRRAGTQSSDYAVS
jgi:P-type Ca2+ transporter type 2C